MVLGKLAFGIVDAVEFPEHAQEVRLPVQKVASGYARECAQRAKPQMLPIEHLLGNQEFLVELLQGQSCG